MNKKTIILIACIVTVILIITFAIFFITKANKAKYSNNQNKITIVKYNEKFNIEKTVEITDKNDIKELTKICDNPSLEQNEDTQSYAIRNDVKVDFNNGKYFMVQLDFEDYCYYEDSQSNTKLIIKMPDGLLEKINEIIK